ncbi:hypothetical protein [Cellulophaga tyrosinoxydans]|uniref:Uncharacterized protein n=1 Tax=Cellulophaga tyrosinoxydans TaxID=504486 RepID=A0A1W2A464_9FLAO|nr:hypothetical protein [Cellulophaga tyrosinoxydans]SMC55465.1 hypothetical protein SAMN05660703_1801 [Cellulophaga tyrosinoxydans]
MYKKLIILYILFALGCSSKKEEAPRTVPIKASLVTQKTNYKAGDSIRLVFTADQQSENIKLHIKNAFGTLLLPYQKQNDQIVFTLPTNFTRKAGLCFWKLIQENETLLKGNIDIIPMTEKGTNMETYFGPRSITAGDNDYSMLVIAPTDVYDNTVSNSTEVTIKTQFLEKISDIKVATNNLMAWYNVRSPRKSGRVLVTALCNGTTSNELTTIVFPANSTDFKIDAIMDHDFADGNQIIKFKSDKIKDEFGNVVSDGTLVTFMIKNQKDAYLYTVGTTIDGVVEARTLHPAAAAEWNIQAYITGASKSNAINVSFKTAIADYEIYFSKGNRNLDIGPLKSFMKQLVPDGILVQLDIYSSTGEFIETKKTTTKKGVSNIFLSPEYLPDGTYKFIIEAVGIKKEIIKEINGG